MSNIFVNLLHIYQSYGYNTRLYSKSLSSTPRQIYHGAGRQQIIWTAKARTIFLLARIQYFLLLYLLYLTTLPVFLFAFLCIGLLALFPLYIVISKYILLPFQNIHLALLIHRAQKKMSMLPDLIVIGIAGSYGKTTQKEVLTHMLSTKYVVLSTLGNQNTLIGIANCILEKLNKNHEIFIVEMGEDHVGDIQQLCNLVHPQIGIITGITQQHMDTFSSYDEVIQTLGELFRGVGTAGKVYMHHDFPEFETYKQYSNTVRIPAPQDIEHLPEFGGISFVYKEKECKVKLLAKHSVYPLITAWEIATSLGIKDNEILETLTTITHVPHRLAPIYNPKTNIWIIDDTYNGNIEGFKSGIDLLKNCHASGKKWYITPGLLQIGNETEEVHFKLGTLLASATEKVILIQNDNTRALEQGLLSKGFPKENIYLFTDATRAHNQLGQLLGNGDVILFQNDIPDLLL